VGEINLVKFNFEKKGGGVSTGKRGGSRCPVPLGNACQIIVEKTA
jgi:hypothetical protein